MSAPGSTSSHRHWTACLAADEDLLPLTVKDSRVVAGRALVRTENYDLDVDVAARVLQVAARAPDALAVFDGESWLSYGRLAVDVMALGERLREEGVRPGDVVAVSCKRSAATIVAFLATQYVAAVCLSVPEDWPAARTASVLTECGVTVVLTRDGSRPLPESVPARRHVPISSTSPRSVATRGPFSEPEGAALPAYIIYTSGSTGAPKGAVVSRRGMMNHLACKVQDLRLGSDDIVAQTAPLAFDISVWQMLAALLVGGRVDVLDDETANTPASLLDAVARREITVLELVPTVLAQFLGETRRAHGPGALRWMIATGEVLPLPLARAWRERHPNVPLLNAYGPTECSDDVTHHIVSSSDGDDAVPIGKPVANTALYVLRESTGGWEACAPGEVGELFVGGAGVGLGYVGDPEKTRRAFFRDTLSGGRRLYRTGDLVRLRSDGLLEYRGRADRQVKVRGMRIELEEIEAALREHPAVAACAVAVKERRSGRPVARDHLAGNAPSPARSILAAYVCLVEPVSAADLRTFLNERIPAKVVPERYVFLSSLPLTANGKTDFAKLPDPDQVRPEVDVAYVPPRTPLERSITSAWAEALQIDRVGLHDKFLELGGDSLVAMRVVAQLRQTTGRHVTFRELLLAETPLRLAEIMEQRAPSSPLAAACCGAHDDERSPSGGASERLALSAYQEGVYFQWRLAPQNPYYTYQGMLRIGGPVDPDRLAKAWNAVLTEHPTLLARFDEDCGKPYQVPGAWSSRLTMAGDMRSMSPPDREAAFRRLAHAEAQIPFDLSSRPALRAALIRFADDEYRLLVTMHEILLDGWGAMVLFSRLADLYRDGGAAAPLPSADFRNYLRWESWHLRRESTADAARHWSSELAEAPPILQLPADRPRPRMPSYRGAIVQQALDEKHSLALDAACARCGATRFTVLLAAFGMVLAYYGDTDDLTIGVPISNRDAPEQAGVVAFLLNMLPLRLFPRHDLTCARYLEAVRDRVLRAFAVSHYPFSWMVRELTRLPRSASHTPIFQVMLNVLNYPKQRLAASDVTFEFVELESGFTKYDLSLYAQPHGDSLLLQLACQTDLFDESTASRILESVTLAICALGERPDAELGAAELLPANDLAALEQASMSA